MNTRNTWIVVAVIGVIVIYYFYTMISKKQITNQMMTDEAMNRIVIEKAQSEGKTFGQALDEITSKIAY